METNSGVRFNLVKIDQILGCLSREIGLSSLDNTLRLGMNGKLSLMRLKHCTIKLKNMTVHDNLLVRNHSLLQIFSLKELNTVLSLLLWNILIHHSKVRTLRVPEHLQVFRVLHGMHLKLLSRWNLLHNDTRVCVLTFRERSVNDNILVRSPGEVLEAFDEDGSLITVLILNEGAVRHLINGDESLLRAISLLHFLIFIRLVRSTIWFEEFGSLPSDIVTVERPLELVVSQIREVSN